MANRVYQLVFNSLNNLSDLHLLSVVGDYMLDHDASAVEQLIRLYSQIFQQSNYCKYVLKNIGEYSSHDPIYQLWNRVETLVKNRLRIRTTGSGGGFGYDWETKEYEFHPSYE